jgi:hypothetical protein
MVPSRTVLVLSAGSLAMGVLLGCGVVRTQGVRAEPRVPVTLSTGPQAGSGASAAFGLPNLPAGLTLDANGMIRGLDRRTEPGTVGVEWELLGAYTYTSQRGLTDLPADLRALDGKRVTLIGFMMPLYEFDDMTQFALVGSHWSCCFGRMPKISELLNVTLAAGRTPLKNTLEPLRVVGTFRAKEVKESGFILSIFSIEDAEAGPLR